jgi:hypothetical protein
MKKNIWISLLIVASVTLLFTNCKKDNSSSPGLVPVLSTTPVLDIKITSASCGGYITSDNGFTVTARGVCWSAGTTPTIDDNKTTDGTGAGNFVSSITGLTAFTTYYVRAYATNSEGTGYGSTMSFTPAPQVGDSYEGGIVGYIFTQDDPGYIASQIHGLIVAPANQSEAAEWGCYGVPIPGANATAIGTGNQNTIAIIAGCSQDGIAAKLCSDLELAGYSDWYLPSLEELKKLYENREAIGGFSHQLYWSSSEGSQSAGLMQDFVDDPTVPNNWSKDWDCFVRAVRTF